MGEGVARGEAPEDNVTRRDLRIVTVWAVAILALYAIGGRFAVQLLRDYKAEAEQIRETEILRVTQAAPASPPGQAGRAGGVPTEVAVGVYVYRVGDFSMKEAVWTADFDVWFRWRGEAVRPGQSFQIADGRAEQRERKEAYTHAEEHYERYHVFARITKHFETSRFPFGEQGLTITVEDGLNDEGALRYVADQRDSGFNGAGIPPTVRIVRSLSGVGHEIYGSRRGDPRVPAGAGETYSRYAFTMLAHPSSGVLFLSMFQALFASVLIAMLAAFIRPIYGDGRFGIGVGAFFAAVANNIAVVALLPPGHRFTLAGMVNTSGLVTIALTLIQSVISLHYYDMGKARFSALFDDVSFGVLLVAYAAVSAALPLAAR